ncbi:MAG: hypothetical protein OXG04_10130 [Acidobacteria bacterium]|nr:hypothetical protein [Acidobacteriota bacterium]
MIRCDHPSFAQDDDRRADLLDHLEDVRAVENDLLGEHVGLDPAEPSDEREVLGAGEVGVQVRGLRHVPDPPPVAEDVPLDVLAIYADLAVRGLDEPGHHVDRGRLPGAVGSEIAEHLAGTYREADVADRGQRTVVLGDPCHFEHATLPPDRRRTASTGGAGNRMLSRHCHKTVPGSIRTTRAAGPIGVRAEKVRPERVGEDDGRLRSLPVVRRPEGAAEQWPYAEHVEELGGDARALDGDRIAAAGQDVAVSVDGSRQGGETLEAGRLRPPRQELRIGELDEARRVGAAGLPAGDEALFLRERKGL